MIEFLPILLKGVVVTIQITAAASVVAIALAFTAGLARLSSNRGIRWLAVGYVELFRGTSLLVQLFGCSSFFQTSECDWILFQWRCSFSA
ncbi:ABC transporter permease subunit [Bradyrhizobium sp. DASA03005]|uniref:ABC transporter permease subunit n=1 Tax=Bradyrhizobium sp. SPXBL-02 TaxID=3395912 RepID=UPI003F7302F7